MEKIGVYLTTFNRANYLEFTIESILNQTYKKFNLYVLDNRSNDNTEEIVRKFNDKRIKYILNDMNWGMVGNWNRALEISNEQYINIFHDDDQMTETYLEQVLKFYEKFPDVIFVHSGSYMIDTKGELISVRIANWEEVTEGDNFLKFYIKKGGSIIAPSVTINKKKLPDYERFDSLLPFTADINFWLRISKYGSIGYINKPLIKYRRHEYSITNGLFNKLDIKIQDRMNFKKFLEQELPQRNLTSLEFAKIPQRYLDSALIADLLGMKLQSHSFIKIIQSAKKFITVSPSILYHKKFYMHLLVSLIPNSFLDYLKKKKNLRKL